MDCRTALTLLEAYLDNELDRAETRELEAHVDTCASCRAALSGLDAVGQALRDPALRHTAPAHLRERMQASIAQAGVAPVSRHYTTPRWWRVAAALVLAFAAGGASEHLWNSGQHAPNDREQIARDLFASHWRALAATSPVDVLSSDRHTVKPWFAGKVADSPLVPDFADQGFALMGGRIDYIGTQRVAVLVYRHGQHVIDVFLMPPSAAAALANPIQLQGYRLNTITLGDQPAAIVSDMDQQELKTFAQLLGSAK